jgi:hypothetical protein
MALRSIIRQPKRGDFGVPSREGIDQAAQTAQQYKQGFLNPRGTDAFRSLMSLAAERTARGASEDIRQGQVAAQRRGFVGGYSDVGERATRERAKALATAGFEGAGTVQSQFGAAQGNAQTAYNQLLRGYEGDVAARDQAYGEALLKTQALQTESDKTWQGQLLAEAQQRQERELTVAARQQARELELKRLVEVAAQREQERGLTEAQRLQSRELEVGRRQQERELELLKQKLERDVELGKITEMAARRELDRQIAERENALARERQQLAEDVAKEGRYEFDVTSGGTTPGATAGVRPVTPRATPRGTGGSGGYYGGVRPSWMPAGGRTGFEVRPRG